MDEKKEALLARVRTEDPKNAYDAEQGVLLVAKNLLAYHPELLDRLKGGAFKTGTTWIPCFLSAVSIYAI